MEEEISVDGQLYLIGHSREYIKAAVPSDGSWKVNDCVQMVPERFFEQPPAGWTGSKVLIVIYGKIY